MAALTVLSWAVVAFLIFLMVLGSILATLAVKRIIEEEFHEHR